jgi:hypothetical protein
MAIRLLPLRQIMRSVSALPSMRDTPILYPILSLEWKAAMFASTVIGPVAYSSSQASGPSHPSVRDE